MLNSRSGQNVYNASTLDRATAYDIKKMPTGIFQLDWFLGGLALDRITRVWGPKNSCKTTLLIKILASSQKFCRHCKSQIHNGDCSCPKPRYVLRDAADIEKFSQEDAKLVGQGSLPADAEEGKDHYFCSREWGSKMSKIIFEEGYRCEPMRALYVETERKFDAEWARKNGVDTGLVVIMGSDWAERTIDSIEEILYTDKIDLLIIDTLSAMASDEDISKSMSDNTKIGHKAVIKSRLLSKLTAIQYRYGVLSNHKLTVVICSQVRTQGIGSYCTFEAPSDGKHMEYAVSVDLQLKFMQYKFTTKERPTFGKYSFTIHKNHTGGATGVTGSFEMCLDDYGDFAIGDTNDVLNAVHYGREFKLVEKKKNYMVKIGRTWKDSGSTTLDGLYTFLLKNTKLYETFRKAVLGELVDTRTPIKAQVGKVLKAEKDKKDG